MPKSNTPYDPQPERHDALSELAREGYQEVPGDHKARLESIHARLGLPSEGISAPEAVVRTLRPRRWLAIAAGIAALVVAGLVLTYDDADQQFAKVTAPVEQNEIETAAASEQAEDNLAEQDLDQVSDVGEEANGVAEMRGPDGPPTTPVIDGVDVEAEKIAERTFAPSASKVAKEAVVKSKDTPTFPAPAQIADEAQVPVLTAEPKLNANAVNANDVAVKREQENPPPATNADKKVEEAAGVDERAAVSKFRMERAPVVATREITGEVLEPSGVPVIGAVLVVEETGQQVTTDQKGEFSIMVGEDAVVGSLTASGYNPLMFDLTKGEEYRLYMPRLASSLPKAQLKGKDVALRLIAPKAEPYAGFDAFVAGKRSALSGEVVTVQFEVNRFGRPRRIVTGPGIQNRDAFKQVKEWLKSGPDWPADYQRKSWRYTVVLP